MLHCRAKDLQHTRDVDDYAAANPYKDTIWLRDRGRVKPMSLDKHHLQRRFDRYDERLAKMFAALGEAKDDSKEQTADNTNLREECTLLRQDLQDLLEGLQEDDTADQEVSFHSEQGNVWAYVPAFVLCMMFALAFTSYRVAFRIIKFVFETLTGKIITDKPTVKFQQDCFRRLGVLCDLQVCLALADERTRTITALRDGTTKKGQQYSAVQLQLFDGRVLSLGVQAVSDGTAATHFYSFHRRLEQILRSKTGR